MINAKTIVNNMLILILISSLLMSGCIDIDDNLKLIGLKEYTKEERVNKVQINNNDAQLTAVIRTALLNTDNDTLKYIVSVNVVNQTVVSKICNVNTAVGCADTSYSGNILSTADIYVSEVSEYRGLCNTFTNTLYHEIGHVVFAKEYGFRIPMQMPVDGWQNSEEKYAENYAHNFISDRCNSKRYLELNEHLDKLNKSLDELNKTISLTGDQLKRWDRYEYTIPYEVYDSYLIDYNNNVDAINKYNNITDEYNYVSEQIKGYINSSEDTI